MILDELKKQGICRLHFFGNDIETSLSSALKGQYTNLKPNLLSDHFYKHYGKTDHLINNNTYNTEEKHFCQLNNDEFGCRHRK